MGNILESKKLVKYKSGKGYPVTVKYIRSSDTHIITYKGKIKEDFGLKKFAPLLIEAFGETFLLIAEKILPILAPLILVSLIFAFLGSAEVMIVDMNSDVGFLSFMLIFLIILVPFCFISLLTPQFSDVVSYYRGSKCETCGKDFSCGEFRIPDIKEISTPDEYSIQITRYWKCRSCGSENVRTSSEGFVTKKEEKMKASSLAKIPCKRCGKTGAYVEYKRPDERKSKCGAHDEIVTRRYYRCKFCGYEDIRAVQADVYSAFDDSPGPSEFRCDIAYEDCPR